MFFTEFMVDSPGACKLRSSVKDRPSNSHWKGSKTMPIRPFNENEDKVRITVIDDERKSRKRFFCSRQLLVSSMRYFEEVLEDAAIDLFIHCEITVFEWLLAFAHNSHHASNKISVCGEYVGSPSFTPSNAMSILISSDFLRMESLTPLCITYISQNLATILTIPLEPSCLSASLLTRLAAQCSPLLLFSLLSLREDPIGIETTVNNDDSKNLIQRLYKERIVHDFGRKSKHFSVCKNCGVLFPLRYKAALACSHPSSLLTVLPSSSSSSISSKLNPMLFRRHTSLEDWSMILYIHSLRGITEKEKTERKGHEWSWEEIYWHLWAASQVFTITSIGMAPSLFLSALQMDNYSILSDGLLIHRALLSDESNMTSSSLLHSFDHESYIHVKGVKLPIVLHSEEGKQTTADACEDPSTAISFPLPPILTHKFLRILVAVKACLVSCRTCQTTKFRGKLTMDPATAIPPFSPNTKCNNYSTSNRACREKERSTSRGRSASSFSQRQGGKSDLDGNISELGRPRSASYVQSLKTSVDQSRSRSRSVGRGKGGKVERAGSLKVQDLAPLSPSFPPNALVFASPPACTIPKAKGAQILWPGSHFLVQRSSAQREALRIARGSSLSVTRKEHLVMDVLRSNDFDRMREFDSFLISEEAKSEKKSTSIASS